MHNTETISYIAWEPGSVEIDGTTYQVGTIDGVTHGFVPVPLLSVDGAFVADMQTTNGGDTANLRYRHNTGSIDVQVEEERSNDLEVGHFGLGNNGHFRNPRLCSLTVLL